MSVNDFKKLAWTLSRDEFAAEWPCAFLTGIQALARPRALHKTIDFEAVANDATVAGPLEEPKPVERLSPSVMAVPIRKTSAAFPQMITVGRTPNNDIILTDFQVSKFHAFFRQTPEGLFLADAGSRNGTFLDAERLVNKAKPSLVEPGARISFGKLRFTLLDAARAWDFLRREVVADSTRSA